MRNNKALLRVLMLTAAGGIMAVASQAEAQQAVATAQNNVTSEGLLGEVVVTATRQSTTINRTPIAVTAVSQRQIDQTGVKDLNDLARMTPSVTFRRSTGGEANPNVAIRGIGSVLGASTTGIYLDDTPLQKRDGPGSASGNGSPFPPLFDLERVEVLRGPQGTLYGGSAQGGAIRFLTPQPSLTRYSVYAKTQVSTVKDGDESYEAGVAVGGPIIQDKLGFRFSIYGRHESGYIDAVSFRTGRLVAKNINTGNTKVARLAVAFAPIEKLRLTASVYGSYDHVSAQDTYWLSVRQYTLNRGTFTNAGTINGVRYDFPDRVFPGGTYGPFNYGPYKNGGAVFTARDGTESKINSPRNTYILLPTITIDYELPQGIAFKSITSFLGDRNKGYAGGLLGCRTTICPTATNSGFLGADGRPVPGGFGWTPLGLEAQPDAYRQFTFFNVRQAFVQEVRLSSPSDWRLNFVGGVYFINSNTKQHTQSFDNENDTSRAIRGVDSSWGLGSANLPGNNSSEREARTNENEIAGFGEVNFSVTSKLKLTAGIRVSRSRVTFNQINGGPVQGPPFGFVGTPAFATTGIVVTDPRCGYDATQCYGPNFRPFNDGPNDGTGFRGFAGRQKEKPISPKFGVSYQATEQNLFYATASKGYRTGGLNQPVPVQTCAQELQFLGITETPLTYNSDTVWSYEGGAKVRVLGNTQINSSVFYIDWKNPQLGNRLRCGQIYTINAGRAVSKGFDVQTQSRLGPVTFNLLVAYTKGEYTEGFSQPTPTGPIVIVNKGDELGAPDWQVSFGAQYDFQVFGRSGYVRGDYQYNGLYKRGVGPGATGYNAFSYKGQATRYAQFRAGVVDDGLEVSVFVNNAFNSQDPLNLTNANLSPLISATTFRPREIGLQVTKRY
jgi:outer membrane receptor protein involved in Fe transport